MAVLDCMTTICLLLYQLNDSLSTKTGIIVTRLKHFLGLNSAQTVNGCQCASWGHTLMILLTAL